MKNHSLEDLYVEQLQDLFDAERQLIKALPKMAKAATTSQLQDAFTEHLDQTKEHANRIEKILTDLRGKAKPKKCKGMAGLLEEGEEEMKNNEETAVLDAALIASAQRVEHYEIAGYGCVSTYAKQLGQTKAAEVLDQILEEEKEADQLLTRIAEDAINVEAGQVSEEK